MNRSDFNEWLKKYGDSWEGGNPESLTELFSDDADYYEVPFGNPFRGIEAIKGYWKQGAEESQKNVSFEFEILGLYDKTGFAHWKAYFERIPSGNKVKLDGILQSTFNSSGKCTEFREWWHREETE